MDEVKKQNRLPFNSGVKEENLSVCRRSVGISKVRTEIKITHELPDIVLKIDSADFMKTVQKLTGRRVVQEKHRDQKQPYVSESENSSGSCIETKDTKNLSKNKLLENCTSTDKRENPSQIYSETAGRIQEDGDISCVFGDHYEDCYFGDISSVFGDYSEDWINIFSFMK